MWGVTGWEGAEGKARSGLPPFKIQASAPTRPLATTAPRSPEPSPTRRPLTRTLANTAPRSHGIAAGLEPTKCRQQLALGERQEPLLVPAVLLQADPIVTGIQKRGNPLHPPV